MDGVKLIDEIFTDYYRRLLGKQSYTRRDVNPEAIGMGAVLTIEQQIELSNPFTEKDIRDVIFSIPNCKSSGRNGYFSGFCKAN